MTVAANLLSSGPTYQSSMLAINAQSLLVQLIRLAKLLMIEKAMRLLPFGGRLTGADRWHNFTVCLPFLEVGKFYLVNSSVSAPLLSVNSSVSAPLLSIYIKDKLQRNRESLGDLGLAKLTSVPPA